jgi:hypothetical protein
MTLLRSVLLIGLLPGRLMLLTAAKLLHCALWHVTLMTYTLGGRQLHHFSF